jgi:hypothetical protein
MRLVPRVKAFRIEESWQVPGQRVRCVVHLTRELSSEEARIVEASSKFHASGATVVYVCRPDESEEYAARLELALSQAVRAGQEPSPSRRRAPAPVFP